MGRKNPKKYVMFAYFPWWANGPYSPGLGQPPHIAWIPRKYGSGSNPGREALLGKVKEVGAWPRTIGLGCEMGARPRTWRVLDKTKWVVGSMAKLNHVQSMNRPLTSVQNMFPICPNRHGMNVLILVYHCWTNLTWNLFVWLAQCNIKLNIFMFAYFLARTWPIFTFC